MKKLPFFLITLIFLAACQNDESNGEEITSEEAIAFIEDTAAQATEDVIDLFQSDGMGSAVIASDYLFYFMEFGSVARTETTKQKILELVRAFAAQPASRVSTEEPSGSFITGVFAWNDLEEDFIFVEEAEVLILKFPVGDSETNNGKFTLTSLELNDYELPELVQMDLTVNETLMVDLFLEVNWSALEIPEDAEVYLYLNPFGFSLGLNLTDGLGTSLSVNMTKGDEQIASIALSAGNIIELLSEELPEIEGYLEYRGLKLDGTIDLGALDEAFTNETDPNEAIDVKVKIEGERVGEIILVLETIEGYTDYYPFIEFNDGTLMNVDELLEDILAEIEGELEGFEL